MSDTGMFDDFKKFMAALASRLLSLSPWGKTFLVLVLVFDLLAVPALVIVQTVRMTNNTINLMLTPDDIKAGYSEGFVKANAKAAVYKSVSETTNANIEKLTNMAETFIDKVLVGAVSLLGTLLAMAGLSLLFAIKNKSVVVSVKQEPEG